MKARQFIFEQPSRRDIGLSKLGDIRNKVQKIQPKKLGTVDADKPLYAPKATFIGTRSELWDPQRARRAEQMEKDGYDKGEIWAATGTMRGLDGRWRQEITDHSAVETGYRPEKFVSPEKIFDHPDLFKAYPFLKNMRIKFYDNRGKAGEGYTEMGWTDGKGKIAIGLYNWDGSAMPTKDVIETLIHEFQHVIQEKEGWSSGGNTSGRSYDDYRALGGEAEAREAEVRRNLTPAERARLFPTPGSDTEYVIIDGDKIPSEHYYEDPPVTPDWLIPDQDPNTNNPYRPALPPIRPKATPPAIKPKPKPTKPGYTILPNGDIQWPDGSISPSFGDKKPGTGAGTAKPVDPEVPAYDPNKPWIVTPDASKPNTTTGTDNGAGSGQQKPGYTLQPDGSILWPDGSVSPGWKSKLKSIPGQQKI